MLKRMYDWLRGTSQDLPSGSREALAAAWPVWNTLPAPRQIQLEGLIQKFLRSKHFEGCGGLRVTNAMKVLIAAQACFMVMEKPGELFPLCESVLVYPGPFVRQQKSVGAGGVVSEMQVTASGESWNGLWGQGTGGPVVLSWPDVLRGARGWDGRNVVIHEFAHQLDGLNGAMDGVPALADRTEQQRFHHLVHHELNALRTRLASGEPVTLHPYAATNPAELFAVGSEKYFAQKVAGVVDDSPLMRAMQHVYG